MNSRRQRRSAAFPRRVGAVVCPQNTGEALGLSPASLTLTIGFGPGLFGPSASARHSFLAYCRDAHNQFVPMQRALAAKDAMMEYITHTGSALFACPSGLGNGEWWGQRLFEA